jgi:hypothetical protein
VDYDPTPKQNSYDIQINSDQNHAAPACSGYPNCLAWQQFEYSSVTLGAVFIEYWLFNYPPAGSNNCPNGLSRYRNDNFTCWGVSPLNYVPLQPITNLSNLQLFGGSGNFYGGTTDVVHLYVPTPEGGMYYTVVQDAYLSLYQWWSQVEVNVLGDFNGSETVFNAPGVVLWTVANITPLQNPGGNWLSYQHGGTSAETTNLTLGTCFANQYSGYIEFEQTD